MCPFLITNCCWTARHVLETATNHIKPQNQQQWHSHHHVGQSNIRCKIFFFFCSLDTNFVSALTQFLFMYSQKSNHFDCLYMTTYSKRRQQPQNCHNVNVLVKTNQYLNQHRWINYGPNCAKLFPYPCELSSYVQRNIQRKMPNSLTIHLVFFSTAKLFRISTFKEFFLLTIKYQPCSEAGITRTFLCQYCWFLCTKGQ